MKLIRGYEDVITITKDSILVIWGAGTRGRTLLQEIRMHNVKNVFIYDENSSSTSDMNERISLKNMACTNGKISFVIAVADDNTAKEILSKIIKVTPSADVYRYYPKDFQYLDKKLSEEGFYNGEKNKKSISGF